jgi:hypothetical protein
MFSFAKHSLCHVMKSIIKKEYPLSDVEEAFQFAIENKPVRVGIRIN